MCLLYSKSKTDKFLKRHQDKKEIVVWKVVVLGCDDFLSPITYTRVKLGEELIGYPLGKYLLIDKLYDKGITDGAIHVFLTRKGARKYKYSYTERVIRCTAKLKDLISCDKYNDDEACFRKIKLGYNERR